MAIYVNKNKKIKNIFVNVNGEKKSVSSVWVNKAGTPTKVFSKDNSKNDLYEVAPADAISNWNYTLDDDNSIIILNYYKGYETDVIVYANYKIDGKTYKTQIASNPSSATRSAYMFNGYSQRGCQNIKSIKFSDSIDTSNVTRMNNMFYSCYLLASLDISNFNTSNVTDMCDMFNGCSSLTQHDLSNFDTSNVTDMTQMFYNNNSLTQLDLSNFDTSNVTSMDRMFASCSKLKSIYVTEGKWSTSQATTTSMFAKCGTSSVTYV